MSITDTTYPILRTNVTGIITVTEQEIIAAMRMVRGGHQHWLSL